MIDNKKLQVQFHADFQPDQKQEVIQLPVRKKVAAYSCVQKPSLKHSGTVLSPCPLYKNATQYVENDKLHLISIL